MKTGVFSSVGLGTWMMETNPGESIRALRAGLDAGANHIDTAEMYGDGRVETLVGEAIEGCRDKIFLVSKVLPQNGGYEATLKACERSLKRLKTDYLDVYLLHWREPKTPLPETFKAFEKLKSDGKIRAWGVSNFNVSDLEESVAIMGRPSQIEGRLVCNQVYYSIQERAVEHQLLPWCQKRDVTLVAYSPLGQGRLRKNAVLDSVAKELKVLPAQVALAFLLRNPDVIVIPKSSHSERTRQNVGSMNIKLTVEQISRLEKNFLLKIRRTLPMI